MPRGGSALIQYVSQNATVPVVKHDKGLCHVFIDKDANHDKAIQIAINAKVSRPGVCNAMETLLIHKDVAAYILPPLHEAYERYGTEIKGCEETRNFIDIQCATHEDYDTEYLANILKFKNCKKCR